MKYNKGLMMVTKKYSLFGLLALTCFICPAAEQNPTASTRSLTGNNKLVEQILASIEEYGARVEPSVLALAREVEPVLQCNKQGETAWDVLQKNLSDWPIDHDKQRHRELPLVRCLEKMSCQQPSEPAVEKL